MCELQHLPFRCDDDDELSFLRFFLLSYFPILSTGLSQSTEHDYRELQREKAWSRIHLVPLLLAEGDRDTYRRQQAALAREREIMKDVKGWEGRVGLSLCIFSDIVMFIYCRRGRACTMSRNTGGQSRLLFCSSNSILEKK